MLVGGLEALCTGPAFQIAAHLPIPAGIGLENSLLAWIVGNGRDGCQDGQCAVPCREIKGVVCC